MGKELQHHIDSLIERYPMLEGCKESIINSYKILEDCFKNGNKLLIAGNGGSCADAEHISSELMKGFMLSRKCSKEFGDKLKAIDKVRGSILEEKLQCGLPTIALHNHQGMNTAFINDIENGGEYVFAQQVFVYGVKGDVILLISTSGSSKNIINASVVSRALGIKVIGLSGESGGILSEVADVIIKVPENETFKIQELHLPIYHCLCSMLEEKFFK